MEEELKEALRLIKEAAEELEILKRKSPHPAGKRVRMLIAILGTISELQEELENLPV